MYGGFALNLLNDVGLGSSFLNHAQQIEFARIQLQKRNDHRSSAAKRPKLLNRLAITAGVSAGGDVEEADGARTGHNASTIGGLAAAGSNENLDIEHGREAIDLLATSKEIALKQDLFDDDLGIVIISGHADHTLGLMLSVNIAIGNIFGRMQSELVGHNVNVLMPSPFAELHDEFLANFARRASSQNSMLNRTRRLMGMKKNGDVFPIELTLRQVSPSAFICIRICGVIYGKWDCFTDTLVFPSIGQISGGLARNIFLGIIKPVVLDTRDHLLLVDSRSKRILGTSGGSRQLLGVSSAEIKDAKVCLSSEHLVHIFFSERRIQTVAWHSM